MAAKWFCDQCGKELVVAFSWTVYGAEGPHPRSFCAEPCLFGWMMEREMAKEEAEEKDIPTVDEAFDHLRKAQEHLLKGMKAEAREAKQTVLVEAVENMLEAAHEFLDEECENAT